jgi:hypothetical protein
MKAITVISIGAGTRTEGRTRIEGRTRTEGRTGWFEGCRVPRGQGWRTRIHGH